MRRSRPRWLTVPLLIALLACSHEPAQPVRVLAGRECQSVEELYLLPERELDLGWAACLLDRELDPELDVESISAALDVRAEDLLGLLVGGDDLERVATAWIRVVGLGAGRRPALIYDVGAPRLADVVLRGAGNCVGSSMAYLAVAQRAGLGAFGVPQPYHIAVRLETSAQRFDVETTNASLLEATAEDGWFFTARDREGGGFGASWGPREVLAFYTLDVGVALSGREPVRALELVQLALEVLPDFFWSHQCLTEVWRVLGRIEDAERSMLRALALRPDDADAWGMLAEIRIEAGRLADAQAALERALALDAEFPPYWFLQAHLHELAGAPEAAVAAVERALKIHETQLHPVRRFHLQQVRAGRWSLEAYGYGLLSIAHAERALALRERAGPGWFTDANREMVAQQLARAIVYALRGEADQGRVPHEQALASVARSKRLAADAHIAALSTRAAQLYSPEE